MGLLDQVLGALTTPGTPGGQSPVQNLLSSMLSNTSTPPSGGQPAGGGFSLGSIAAAFLGGGGRDPQMASAVAANTGINPQSAVAAGLAGLPALLSLFHNSGLGAAAQSWVGQGPNQPVAPEQVAQAFGENHVQAMAQQTGIPVQSLLAALAAALPQVVDQLTNRHPQLTAPPPSESVSV